MSEDDQFKDNTEIISALPDDYETNIFLKSLCVFAKKLSDDKWYCTMDSPKRLYRARGTGIATDQMMMCASCKKREQFAKLEKLTLFVETTEKQIQSLKIELKKHKELSNKEYFQDQIQKLQKERKLLKEHSQDQIQKLQEEIRILSADKGIIQFIKKLKHSKASYCLNKGEMTSMINCLNSLASKKCTLTECKSKENVKNKFSKAFKLLEKDFI